MGIEETGFQRKWDTIVTLQLSKNHYVLPQESLSRKQQSRRKAEAEASFQSYKGNGWINSRGSRYLATKGRKTLIHRQKATDQVNI